jgi:dipeptidyl aminopeptidase/acylaminoacyl peptidase
MQTDVSDGERALAADGTIDPKRVCIVGASYGGYAALAGATLDTSAYRCAVSVAGLSDLSKFIKWRAHRSGRSDSSATRYWERFMGAKDADDDALAEISPVDHVSNVSIPVLLIHGEDDTVVPIEQSTMMADALKKAGKDVQFISLANEDHWLSRSETRAQMLSASVAFLEKNNPP